jgi:asparagine synthase (glutamine-hydrolysing)
MCGIAGFIDPNCVDLEAAVQRMTHALEHRGPDDTGSWIQARGAVALGHRRLSIIDLSPAGHQPMLSRSGRYVLVFNGEIYNHAAIRSEIEGRLGNVAWRGHSDTETLLAAIEELGVAKALERCTGMFAIAVWDQERRRLILARDRIGEKPLYFGRFGRAFLFGSELKALRAHSAFRGEIDRESLASYLRYGYVPDPRSIYQGVSKLLPGTYLEVDEHGNHGDWVTYWSAREIIGRGRRNPFTGSDAEAIGALEHVLGESVARQMVSDVPLGAFLSGGIDSSLIVALMQARSSRRIRTFTIGFAEAAYDESKYARKVAEHLGTEHTELLVTPEDTMRVIPRLPEIYDEPFGDSSQVPTFLVAQLARQQVTVALSGDAGDELFYGYTRYPWTKRMAGLRRKLRGPLGGLVTGAIRARSTEWWSGFFDRVRPLTPRRLRMADMGHKMHRFAALMSGTEEEIYRSVMSHWQDPAEVVSGVREPDTRLTQAMAEPNEWPLEEDMMYWDTLTYLPGDILVKVDRAAMAVSLETRVPMLDHNVVEFAWSLPLHMRDRAGEGKWALKQLLSRYVPRSLTDRPKTGFGIPFDLWLRGPLRDWAEALLDESRLRAEGFFHPAPIRRKWSEHLSGRHNWAYWLWDVLMFQAWWQAQGGSRAESLQISGAA